MQLVHESLGLFNWIFKTKLKLFNLWSCTLSILGKFPLSFWKFKYIAWKLLWNWLLKIIYREFFWIKNKNILKMIRKTIFASTGPTQTLFHAMEIKNLMEYLIIMKVFFLFSPTVRIYSPKIIFLLEYTQEMAFRINLFISMAKVVKSSWFKWFKNKILESKKK